MAAPAPSAELLALLQGGGSFESLVEHLQLADNEQRKQAEAVFDELKEHYPDVCTQFLVKHLRTAPSVDHRAFCAIMLRKVLTKDGDPPFWSRCSPSVQGLVKTELLNCLKDEQQMTVARKVCDTISELAAITYDEAPGWPELLPAMFQCVQSGSAPLTANALSIFADLAMYLTEPMRPHLPTLVQVLGQCIGSSNSAVQLGAVRAVASFIGALEEPAERDKFQHMIQPMLQVLSATLTAGDEASAQEVLEMFINVAEAHPRFLRRQLGEVVAAMLTVAGAASLESGTRSLAAEFLVTLCEARDKAPGMMRKLPHLAQKLFETLMVFLLDIEDDPLWHNADSDDHDDVGSGELYEFGQECLDRVAIALGGNAIVSVAGQLLPTWLSDGADWRKRNAALICLAQIAEGCAKVMSTSLEPLVSMCLKGLADSSAKVRWASCQALGQMCTDLGPEIQDAHHAVILPALMAVMDDFNNPRVQAHASAAVVNFSERVDAEVLPPYLDTLITKLMTLLQHGRKLVQEGALTAMASVADSSQQLFVKYYDGVMPLLTSILTGASDKAHRMLRAKALECISLVGMAVGKERFRDDARAVMQFLQQLQQTEMDPDDPTIGYMLQAGARLCKCLGAEFIPYLAVVMPPLLKSAQLEPDIKVREADDGDDGDDDDGEVEVIPLGDKVLHIRTSTLEEKATACNMLCCYAGELGEGFLPWVKTTADIMVPLLKFYFHEEVRRAAVQTLPELLRSVVLALEKGQPGAEYAMVPQLLEFVWPPLTEALGKEPEPSVQACVLESLVEIIELVDPGQLREEWVAAAFKKFDAVLRDAEGRRQERAKRQATEDFDEEELEALEEENEVEEELFDQVGTCMGAFLKKFNDAVLPYVEALMPQIAPLLDVRRNAEERRIAICIVDDLLEHSPQGRAKYFSTVLPILLEASGAANPDLRQCSAYGLGILAAKAPELFRPVAVEAAKHVAAALSRPDAKSEDNETATDNAVSCLGRILEHHGEALDAQALAALWLGQLPLKADTVEAQAMHEQLLRMTEARDARLLGPNNEALPRVLAVFAEVLSHGTRLVEGPAGLRMAALLHQMQASVPPDAVQAAMARMDTKQSKAFTIFMSGQVPGADS